MTAKADTRIIQQIGEKAMKIFTQGEVEKVIRHYDPDHDIGPDCPVTWREERLAEAVLELAADIERLEAKVSALLDAVPSAARDWGK